MITVSRNVVFGPPMAGADAGRPPVGRRCDVVGCETMLSRYNGADVCWLHARAEYRLAPRHSRSTPPGWRPRARLFRDRPEPRP